MSDSAISSHLWKSDSMYGLQAQGMQLEQIAFRERFQGDMFTAQRIFTVESSLVDVIEAFRAQVAEPMRLSFVCEFKAVLVGTTMILTFVDSSAEDDPWEMRKRNIRVTAMGEGDAVRAITNHAKSYPKLKNPRITWNYLVEGKRQEAVVFSEAPRTAPDSFYPYIEGGIEAYVRRYMESTASILLLRGEPGTGKTSFIQNLIWTMNTDSMITYEEKLFHSDEMFVTFLTSLETNLLIMEDADTMLLTRERHGNQTMAKFLNVSDGLIRFPRKKVIISSNLVDDDRIDTALMRPGRCFDTPVFRKLTYTETLAACADAEREPPTEHRDYALSEILNAPAKPRHHNVIGFTGFKPVVSKKGA